MEGQRQNITSVGEIRKMAVTELIEDANQVFSGSRGDQMLTELRKHINLVFREVAKLKMLEGSTLSTANLAVAVSKEGDENTSRLNHMRVVADAMFYLNEDIKLWNVPQFDVLTSFCSLGQGNTSFFPSIVDEVLEPRPLKTVVSASLLSSVSYQILSLLDKLPLRPGIRLDSVRNGVATLFSEGEFEVKVTLTQAPASAQGASVGMEKQTRTAAPDSLADTAASEIQMKEMNVPSFNLDILDTTSEKRSGLERSWWWSLTELNFFLMDNDGVPFFEEFQIEYLRREFDARMVNLAERMAIRSSRQQEADPSPLPEVKPQEQLNRAEGTEYAKTGDHSSSINEDQSAPLELLLDICRDLTNRVALSLTCSGMREIISESSPFRTASSIVVSEKFKPGYRFYYWLGVPIIVDSILQGHKTNNQWSRIRPWFEVGVSDKGYIELEHSPEISAADCSLFGEKKPTTTHAEIEMLILKSATLLSQQIMCTRLFRTPNVDCVVRIASLLIELNRQNEIRPGGRLHFVFQEVEYGLSSRTGMTDAEVYSMTSPTINCYLLEDFLVRLCISPVNGRLRLDGEEVISHRLQNKLVQWEETLNRTWRHAARTMTTEAMHPHAAALAQLAGMILRMANQLARMIEPSRNQGKSIICAKHGLQFAYHMPIQLANEFVRTLKLDEAALSEDFCVSLRRITFSRANVVACSALDSCLHFHFILSMRSSSSRRGREAYVIVLALDSRGSATQIVNMVAVPAKFYQNGSSELRAKKRKQSTMDESRESKREKRAHDSDLVLQMAPDWEPAPHVPFMGADDDIGEKVNKSHVADVLQSRELFAWCNEQGLLEALKEQFHAIGIAVAEEVLLLNDGYQTHKLRLSEWQTRVPSVCCDEVEDVKVGVLDGGDAWRALILLAKSSDQPSRPDEDSNMCPLTSWMPTHAELNKIQESKPSSRQKLFGTARTLNGHISITYGNEHSVEHLLCDLFMISQIQAFMSRLHVFQDNLSMANIKQPTEETIHLSMERTGFLDIVMFVHRIEFKEPMTADGDDEDTLLVKWRLRFSLGRNAQTEKNREQEKKAFVQEDLRCQIRCDVQVPRLLLARFEELVQKGAFDKFLLVVWLTSATLCSIQSLWLSSGWKLHLLPQSDVLKWCFLCVQRNVERTLTMEFHESGFLFLRVSDIRNLANAHVHCQPINHVKNISEQILTLLDRMA